MAARLLTLAWLCTAGCDAPTSDEVWGVAERRSYLPRASERFNRTDERPGRMSVAVPAGVYRGHFAVVGEESVEVGESVRIFRSEFQTEGSAVAVASLGSVQVGGHAEIGAIYNLGASPVVLGAGAVVQGYVRASGEAVAEERVSVRDGVLEHALDGVDVFEWIVSFPESGAMPVATDAGPLLLPPGTYGALRITPGSLVRVETGTYRLESLLLEAGGVLDIDNTRGPVYLWVRDALQLAGQMRDYLLQGNVLLGYAGVAPPVLQSDVRLTLVAPRAAIIVPSTPRAHSGAFFARSVRLAPYSELEHRPFSGIYQAPPSPCDYCAAEAELAAIECCRTDEARHATARADCAACAGQTCPGCADAARTKGAVSRYALESCAASAERRYSECELKHRYRAGACQDLGFAPPRQAVCAAPLETWSRAVPNAASR